MRRQMTLDFPLRPALGRDDFWVTACNREVVKSLEAWKDWPTSGFIICGPSASGKSHLLAVWQQLAKADIWGQAEIDALLVSGMLPQSRAIALDDIERLVGEGEREKGLFHLINILTERGGHLLLAASCPPASWPVRLPDLASRLAAFPVQSLNVPDDDLLAALLIKQFSDRQLSVSTEVISFLLARMERSFAAVCDLVQRLDLASLREKRMISIPLARRILAEINAPEIRFPDQSV